MTGDQRPAVSEEYAASAEDELRAHVRDLVWESVLEPPILWLARRLSVWFI